MMTPEEKLYSSAADMIAATIEGVGLAWSRKCESPIEILLFKAMCTYHWLHYGCAPKFDDWSGGDHWHIRTQFSIKKYRVDFMLTVSDVKQKFIIECDGHDFHERTKEQAQRDRRRDRELQEDGYIVVRFTGSEIWRDPWDCADQINNQVLSAFTRENPIEIPTP